jgi:Ricin-type beta-trefoil lectin domain/Putative Ig domain
VKISRLLVAATSAASVVLLAAASASAATSGTTASSATSPDYVHSCAGPVAPGYVKCLALKRTNVITRASIAPNAAPDGYSPADLQAAYKLATAAAANGGGATVAIVDAFDDPNAASDLATYRAQFNLPACTVANGCFTKLNQSGAASPLPKSNAGWSEEISLDLDMVSAICPNCHILLVEASGTSDVQLGKSVDVAVAAGAKFVSNSYGGNESKSDPGLDTKYYKHPGVVVTASAGDDGYGVEYPAASRFVTSVGGTSLSPTDHNARGWTESAWGVVNSGTGSGTGSGCSKNDAKPAWQADTGCAKRTVADVSAVADPNAGVAIFDTFGSSDNGWEIFGGTSAASPVIAATYALAGAPKAGTYPASYPYAHANGLNDVTIGLNGRCGGTYLCQARAGYDGPTGLGTPEGLTAFTAPANTIAVTKPATQKTNSGKAASLTIAATDTDAGQTLTYTASGLPAGLSISSAGVISGTPTTLGRNGITVTVTDAAGNVGRVGFTWSVMAHGEIHSALSSSRCLTVRGGSLTSGARVVIAACNGGAGQQWTVFRQSDGSDVVQLTSGITPNKACVAVKSGRTAAGSPVNAQGCGTKSSASAHWKVGNHSHLVGVKSGRCLTDPSAGPNGTQVQIAHCNPSKQQGWVLPS